MLEWALIFLSIAVGIAALLAMLALVIFARVFFLIFNTAEGVSAAMRGKAWHFSNSTAADVQALKRASGLAWDGCLSLREGTSNQGQQR